MALPPRVPAAATKLSKAKLWSSVAARDLMLSMAYGCNKAIGSSSGSGISSTTYTSSRDSALSSELDLASQLECIDDEVKVKRRERARRLAKEFCHGDGDIATLERWLSEMGVGWVLDIAANPSAVALTDITKSTHLENIVRGKDVPGRRVQLLGLVEATVRKMLPFVDAWLAATDLDASNDTAGVSNGAQMPSEKLQALLGVRDALSSASEGIQSCFAGKCSAETGAQRSKLLSLLSEKNHRMEESIWKMMQEGRNSILNDSDDNNEWDIQTSQGSSDICKVSRSIVIYIKSLWGDYWRLNHIVRAAAELGSYVPNRDIVSSFHLSAQQDKTNPFTTLTLEMIFSLEEKLAKRSESFPDNSLRFLFLINNTHFIRQELHPLFQMKFHTLTPEIEGYIQKYLQASWAPVMSCLCNPTTRWFRKKSALPKFDLEFQKTYSVHKLWKVPDPKLRTLMREAVIEQVVPGLTRFLQDNSITNPGVTPQERKEMLLELFEG